MSTIREKLKHGDIKVLAGLAGVSLSTAEKTIYGTRNNPRVKEAALRLIESREQITKQLRQRSTRKK